MVSLLIKNYLYDDAITVLLAFKSSSQNSPLIPVFSGLVDRCCNLTSIALSKEYDDGMSTELLAELEIIKQNESVETSISPYSK